MSVTNVIKLLFITMFFALGGCSTVVTHQKLVEDKVSIFSPNYFSSENLSHKFSREWRGSRPPEFGLALAGGGTKAADFSLGVIQGLDESGVMKNVDIISTVSGGGYAGLWYYMRHLDTHPAPFSVYQDCLSVKYRLHDNETGYPICPKVSLTNYDPESSDVNSREDNYRYQNYIRAYQDVLSSGKDFFGNRSFNYGTTSDDGKLTNDIGVLTISTVGASIVNLVPNVLFDWEVPLSPTRHAYATGINRTYGANPPKCDDANEPGNCDSKSQEWREEGDLNEIVNLKFTTLEKLHRANNLPMWIINATAGEDRSPWDFAGQSHPEMTAFEFTPYGSGSGIYGYSNNPLYDRVSVFDAVVSSAAFFDSQQKNFTEPPLRNIASLGMKLSTLNWGSSYRNPNASPIHNILHHALPWPLYYFHKFNAGSDSNYIHLSDGGMSEDLGVYSLVRRGVPNIIISDHSADRGGAMADVCRLKQILQDSGDKNAKNEPRFYLHIPALHDLDKVCEAKQNVGYDIYNWSFPILLGCISSVNPKENEKYQCEKPSDDSNGYYARMFVIKPSFDKTTMGKKLEEIAKNCKVNGIYNQSGAGCEYSLTKYTTFVKAGEFYNPKEDKDVSLTNPWPFEEKLPRELVMFILRNSFNSDGTDKNDGCPYFPQNSTVSMTANSSPWLYGAYRELGRYYARQLGWFFSGDNYQQTFEKKYMDVVRYQAEYSLMCPQLYHPNIFSSSKAGEQKDCMGLNAN